MPEGRSNAAIAAALVVTEKAVGKHITSIFTKLDLPAAADDTAGRTALPAGQRLLTIG